MQATNSVYSDADRIALNTEVQSLVNEVDNILNGVSFAEKTLLNGVNKQIDTELGSKRTGSWLPGCGGLSVLETFELQVSW